MKPGDELVDIHAVEPSHKASKTGHPVMDRVFAHNAKRVDPETQSKGISEILARNKKK